MTFKAFSTEPGTEHVLSNFLKNCHYYCYNYSSFLICFDGMTYNCPPDIWTKGPFETICTAVFALGTAEVPLI